jgi:hypothetical protein
MPGCDATAALRSVRLPRVPGNRDTCKALGEARGRGRVEVAQTPGAARSTTDPKFENVAKVSSFIGNSGDRQRGIGPSPPGCPSESAIAVEPIGLNGKEANRGFSPSFAPGLPKSQAASRPH